MDSFELNKILGALLGTCLVLLAVHIASGAIFAPPVAAKPGYVIEVKQETAGRPERRTGAPAPAVPIENLLGQRLGSAGRADRQGMRVVPQPRQGPGGQDRTGSLRRRGPQGGFGGRL